MNYNTQQVFWGVFSSNHVEQHLPYPAPPFAYEICETPWTVQSLWWHYRYTLDGTFLERAYPLLRAAARFLAAYASKDIDGKYHIVPTVSPENWGFTVDYRLNRDCSMDLALTEFVLDAAIEASQILNMDHADRGRWTEIRANLCLPDQEEPGGCALREPTGSRGISRQRSMGRPGDRIPGSPCQ